MASKKTGFAFLLILVTLTSALSPVALLLSWPERLISQFDSSQVSVPSNGNSAVQWMLVHTGYYWTGTKPVGRINLGRSFEYKIVLTQTNISLVQGASTSLGVSVLLTRGIAETVELAVFGTPSGADIKVDPPRGLPSYSATLTISTGPSTLTGDFSITILGLSSAGLVRKAVLTLRIGSPVHDVAVVGLNSPATATIGDVLKYDVTVSNYGSLPEKVNVQLLVNDTIATTSVDVVVPALSRKELFLEWDTRGYSPGTYRVAFHIPPVESETNLENNIFKAGNLELKPRTNPAPTHPAQLISILPRDLVITAAAGEVAVALYLFLRRRKPSMIRWTG